MKRINRREPVARYADRFAALGAEPRLRILRLLLQAHPRGLAAGGLQRELGIPASTLSHHLDKLKSEELVRVRRAGTYLWYAANTAVLQELLDFLYAECCACGGAISPGKHVSILPRAMRRVKGDSEWKRRTSKKS